MSAAERPLWAAGDKTERYTCALCRSNNTAVLFVKDATEYSECRECSFRFSSPSVNPNLANTLSDYEAAYLQYLAPEPADELNFASLRAWMERRCSLRDAHVLDIGAGSGKFVRYLRACGVVAEGLEPSRSLFERYLSNESGFTCDLLDNYRGSTGRQFGVITAFDVIEHVAEPEEFLGDVAALLEPGGVFFVSTPDVASVAARLFGRRWHFYYPYHLSYFSPNTLIAAAKRHGLTPIEVRHRGKRRSLGYVIRYGAEFVAHRSVPRWAKRFDSWYMPINLFDVMYLCFRRNTA